MCKKLVDDVKRSLYNLGIHEGEFLYIASDITRLMVDAKRRYGMCGTEKREAFLCAFIEAFQEVVGREGTLLFPVFTWGFCKGKGFDRRYSLGETGALNNWILRNRQDFLRTQHPLYSFMVWGLYAKELAAMENVDAWGDDSPFAWLYRHGGKLLLFDVSLQKGFTFVHYVGEKIRVPYRYFKNFRGEYTDLDGKKSIRNYTMYVRDLSIIMEAYFPDSFLEDAGIMHTEKIGEMTLKLADLQKAYDVVVQDLKERGGKHCYYFKDYSIDWDKDATHPDDLDN